MQQNVFPTKYKLVYMFAAMLAASPAMAGKPSWAGGSKPDKHRQDEQHDYRPSDRRDYGDRDHGDRHYKDKDRSSYSGGRFFIDRQRTAIRDYYLDQYRRGHCPPGLAKKRNGCMPPGQAKNWEIGRPLSRDVIFYDLPRDVAMTIGYPPPGYRFVRVASDILMIAIGTSMVMDAVYDLGGVRW